MLRACRCSARSRGGSTAGIRAAFSVSTACTPARLAVMQHPARLHAAERGDSPKRPGSSTRKAAPAHAKEDAAHESEGTLSRG